MGSGSGAVAAFGRGGDDSRGFATSFLGLCGSAGRFSLSARRFGGSWDNFGTLIRLVRYLKFEHS